MSTSFDPELLERYRDVPTQPDHGPGQIKTVDELQAIPLPAVVDSVLRDGTTWRGVLLAVGKRIETTLAVVEDSKPKEFFVEQQEVVDDPRGMIVARHNEWMRPGTLAVYTQYTSDFGLEPYENNDWNASNHLCTVDDQSYVIEEASSATLLY